MVSVPSGRGAPGCSQEPIGTRTMSERSWNQAMSGGARSSRQWETGRSDIHGLRDEGEVARGHDVGERVVVDVRVDELERDAGAQIRFQRLQEGAVGLRVP